ncbi:Unknown protein, partial [Striga hermonthica]
ASPVSPMPTRLRPLPAYVHSPLPASPAPSPASSHACAPAFPRPSRLRPSSACAPCAHPVFPVTLPPSANASQSTSVACSPTVHPRTPSCPFDHLRASRHNARSLLVLAPLSSTDSKCSPDGHGSQPSNPIQSPARQIQPSSILCLPLLRASIFQTHLFLAQGLHQNFPFLSFALCFLWACLALRFRAFTLNFRPHSFGQSRTHDGRCIGLVDFSSMFSNHMLRSSPPSSSDSSGLMTTSVLFHSSSRLSLSSRIRKFRAPSSSWSLARPSHAHAVARALLLPCPACACTPAPSTPTPARSRSAPASASPVSPMPTQLRPLPAYVHSPLSASPAPSSASSHACATVFPRPPRPRPSCACAPFVHSVVPVTLPPNANAFQSTFVACSPTVHPRTPSCPFDHLCTSRHDARSLLVLAPLSPTDSKCSPDGYGSQPSNPIQSSACQIQPSSIFCLPLFRDSIFQTHLFLAQGLHQHFPYLAFALCFLRACFVLRFRAFTFNFGPDPFGQSRTHDGRYIGLVGSSSMFSNHMLRSSKPSSSDSPGLMTTS